jgi:hypothetical protein
MIKTKSLSATEEQIESIDLFSTGESLKINAFAGSGKTATLQLLADTSKNAGIYLAFNKTLAEEAKLKFPYWVTCRTCHSLAYQSTHHLFRKNKEKMFGVLHSSKISNLFPRKNVKSEELIKYSPSLIAATLTKFLQSADDKIELKHVPEWGKLTSLKKEQLEEIKRDIVRNATTVWERMTDSNDSSVPLGHDGYFKIWALKHPRIHADYILLDEAQDTAPVMLGILREQNCQVVLAGDKYQQIYEWRGAINAMELFNTINESTLTQSFRFGETIAQAATKLLSSLGEEKVLRGNPKIISKLECSDPNVILCRTNAGVIDHTLKCLELNIIPHILGGNGEIIKLLNAVSKLKAGEHVDIPEFFGFTTWQGIIAFSKSEEGVSLKTLVKIVEKYGEDCLLKALSKTKSSEQDAQIIISTVHRAKGRQWNKVFIIDDFGMMEEKGDNNKTEKQLMYVALTRAREEVQLPYSVASMLDIRQDFQTMAFCAA